MNRYWVRKTVAAVVVTVSITGGACRRSASPEQLGELPAESATHWTDKTELFVEHPPLVGGKTVRFAVHLTKLNDFQALNAGWPSIELRANDGRVTTLPGTPPLRPGAFRVEGQIPAAGQYTWSLLVDAPGLADRHDLGSITVHPNEQAARGAVKTKAGAPTIAYLKEQQWTNEFATVIVRQMPLRIAIRAPGRIAPMTGGEAVVAAPAAGRLVVGMLPEIGARVSAGQVLGRFAPRLTAIEDRATLVRQVAEARAAMDAAQAERDRAERLLAERAVPARRVEDAKRALAVAQAQLHAAETRLQQRDQTLNRGGADAGSNAFVLRSPIPGRLAEIKATPGATFDEGAELFRVVRTDRVVLEAAVPIADAGRARDLAAVELEAPGETDPIRLPVRRVSDPGVIDSTARALMLRIEIENPGGRLLVGQTGTAVLYTRQQTDMAAIPRTAILTESGRPIVFVQVEGERFEKRRIETGPRDGDWVGLRSGVKPGERVVSRGAYEVLLASAARGLPAEGHVH